MTSEVDVPGVAICHLAVGFELKLVVDYNKGVIVAVPCTDLEGAAVKAAAVLLVLRGVKLELVVLIGVDIGIFEFDHIVGEVPKLRFVNICVLLVISDPFEYSVAFLGFDP